MAHNTTIAFLIVFLVGIFLVLLGVGIIGVSTGAFQTLEIYKVQIGPTSVSTDDPQVGGGLIIAIIGIIMVSLSLKKLR